MEANEHYDRLIERERSRIDTVLGKRNACTRIDWIALPQLFVPSFSVWRGESSWGTPLDHAQALNPNTVNVIALGKELLMPQQSYTPFEREIETRLTPLRVSLVRVDSTYSHFLNGGLHCNTSVIRMCHPREIQRDSVHEPLSR